MTAKAKRMDGFTIVEMMVAMLVLLVGVLALAGALDASGKLTQVSERESVMSHVARNELERLQTLSYSQLAMTGNPVVSTDSSNPDYYVSTQSGSYYLQWDPSSSSKEQLAVDSTNGVVSPTAQSWTKGNIGGSMYDFVTYHTDGSCGGGCPSSQNYKRIVVEVTQSTSSFPKQPVIVQTLVADQNASPSGFVVNGLSGNPVNSSGTYCPSSSGNGPCQIGIDTGTADTLYLYDSSAGGSYSGSPTTSNLLHDTTGVITGLLCTVLVTTGCPTPDLMGTIAPAGSTLYNYSTDLGGSGGGTSGGGSQYTGGRLLKKSSTSCSSPPSPTSTSTNSQAETWVTGPVSSQTKLNGNGGMTLFMQSASGVTVSVRLCLAIWVYPQSLLNLINVPPVEVGAFAYAIATLPATPIPVSFSFNLGATQTLTVGQRIGVEVWLDTSSSANAAIQYDDANVSSLVQLNVS